MYNSGTYLPSWDGYIAFVNLSRHIGEQGTQTLGKSTSSTHRNHQSTQPSICILVWKTSTKYIYQNPTEA